MKKLFSLLVLSIIFFACNNDIDESIIDESISNNQNIDYKKIIDDKYDGQILKFKNEGDFIAFYKMLTNLNQSDFNYFLTIKGDNNSSFYRDLFLEEEEEEEKTQTINMDAEVENSKKLIISEYLSTIFNSNNEILIKNKVIRLDKSGDLISIGKNGQNVIGNINNSNNLLNELSKRHNVNYTKSWRISTGNDRRATLSIFNETVYINNMLSTSKIFYRIHQQYKSCSFWRCRWKNDNKTVRIYPKLNFSSLCQWTDNGINIGILISTSVYTINISNYKFVGPCQPGTLYINGSVNYNNSHTFSNIAYDFNPF